MKNQGTGTLHPKLNNRFRVLFVLDDNSIETTDLSMQVTRVSKFSCINPGAEFGLCVFDNIKITIDDDTSNKANTVIKQLCTSNFSVVIETLDCNNIVLDRYTFENASIADIKVSSFDYGDTTIKQSLGQQTSTVEKTLVIKYNNIIHTF